MLGYAARVFRHCYANIITTSSNGLQLFEGTDEHKLPFHSQQLVLRGLFSMLGQTMAHVITHTHFVIMGLARPVAIYLATGCPETACAIVVFRLLRHFVPHTWCNVGSSCISSSGKHGVL